MDTFSSQFTSSPIPIESLQPMMWDNVMDQQMITSYNQMLQQATDFYGSIDSSSSPASPSSSDASSPTMSSRRTSKAMGEMRGAIPDKVERRREQNRQSQRAYRDRKEKHQRDLEGQIAVWKDKHEKLIKSYANQAKQVSQLKAQIDDLNTQVLTLQTGLPDMWGPLDISQQDFDLVPFYDKKTGSWSRSEIE